MAIALPYRRPVVVPTIIFLNVAVFFLWIASIPLGYFPLMENNFLVSWDLLMEGRVWVALTSVFSHNLFIHIFVNMFVLSSFGSVMETVLGKRSFTNFYLLAGIVSSLSHSVVSKFLLGEGDLKALGASGSVSGLVLLFSLMFPREKILVFGLVPIPALVGALVFIGFDVWGLIEQAQGSGLPIGHGAHLGGALTGAVYYFFHFKRRRSSTFYEPW